MKLTRTTILPAEPAAATQLFRQLVFGEPEALLVVFDETSEAEALVAEADKMAGKLGGLAHVVWARRRQAIWPVVEKLTVAPPSLAATLPSCRALAISLMDQIRDVLPAGGPAPDLLRLFEAFNNALSRDD